MRINRPTATRLARKKFPAGGQPLAGRPDWRVTTEQQRGGRYLNLSRFTLKQSISTVDR